MRDKLSGGTSQLFSPCWSIETEKRDGGRLREKRCVREEMEVDQRRDMLGLAIWGLLFNNGHMIYIWSQ